MSKKDFLPWKVFRGSSEVAHGTKSEEVKKLQPSALLNIGATCYLNSALQGISACDTFVMDINDLYNKNKDGKVDQLNVFKELLAILNGCSKRQMEISRNPIFRKWNKTGQQDSYEVLVHAMNEVYNELRKNYESLGRFNKKDLNKWLEERLPMRFILQYDIVCDCGMSSSSPLQSDLALHVVIPRDRNEYHLNELLDRYFQREPIEDYQCDSKTCKKQKAYKKARLLRPLPRTICIHLQRTYWNGYKMVKIDNIVAFENTLDIKTKYCSEENVNRYSLSEHKDYGKIGNDIIKRGDLCQPSNNRKSNGSEIGGSKRYKLVSVIVHYGTVYGGHYVCYKLVGDQWFLTNDSSVRKVSDQDVLRCQAYILFYEQPYDRADQLTSL